MTQKPVFPDCHFPDDCLCAALGYALERTSCAAPDAAAAAYAYAFRRKSEGQQRLPVFDGTALPIAKTDDLCADILAALKQIASDCPYNKDEVARIMRSDMIAAGLQAEAGRLASRVTVFRLWKAELASGASITSNLVLSPTRAGDAVFYLFAVLAARSQQLTMVTCGSEHERDQLTNLLVSAGGGQVGKPSILWTEAPTADDLAKLENL